MKDRFKKRYRRFLIAICAIIIFIALLNYNINSKYVAELREYNEAPSAHHDGQKKFFIDKLKEKYPNSNINIFHSPNGWIIINKYPYYFYVKFKGSILPDPGTNSEHLLFEAEVGEGVRIFIASPKNNIEFQEHAERIASDVKEIFAHLGSASKPGAEGGAIPRP